MLPCAAGLDDALIKDARIKCSAHSDSATTSRAIKPTVFVVLRKDAGTQLSPETGKCHGHRSVESDDAHADSR